MSRQILTWYCEATPGNDRNHLQRYLVLAGSAEEARRLLTPYLFTTYSTPEIKVRPVENHVFALGAEKNMWWNRPDRHPGRKKS